mgnify:CR=1 FL=1
MGLIAAIGGGDDNVRPTAEPWFRQRWGMRLPVLLETVCHPRHPLSRKLLLPTVPARTSLDAVRKMSRDIWGETWNERTVLFAKLPDRSDHLPDGAGGEAMTPDHTVLPHGTSERFAREHAGSQRRGSRGSHRLRWGM